MSEQMSFGDETPVCSTCGDRRVIWSESLDQDVPCPRCRPVPDQQSEVDRVREDAIKRADKPPSDAWKQHAHEMIRQTCLRLAELTSEDVWESGLQRPDNGSPDGDALGPAMRRAAKDGMMVFAGRVSSETKRPQRHNNPKRVWRSLIYDGQVER